MHRALAAAAICLAASTAAAEPATRPIDMIARQQAELEAARAELRALGVPLTPAEFAAKHVDVAKEANAAVAVKAAFAAMPDEEGAPVFTRLLGASDANLPRLEGELAPVEPKPTTLPGDLSPELRAYLEKLEESAGVPKPEEPVT